MTKDEINYFLDNNTYVILDRSRKKESSYEELVELFELSKKTKKKKKQ